MNQEPSKPDDYRHCFTPDTFEDRRQNGGAVAWMVIALLLVGLWLAGFTINQLIQTDKSPVPTKAVTTERP